MRSRRKRCMSHGLSESCRSRRASGTLLALVSHRLRSTPGKRTPEVFHTRPFPPRPSAVSPDRGTSRAVAGGSPTSRPSTVRRLACARPGIPSSHLSPAADPTPDPPLATRSPQRVALFLRRAADASPEGREGKTRESDPVCAGRRLARGGMIGRTAGRGRRGPWRPSTALRPSPPAPGLTAEPSRSLAAPPGERSDEQLAQPPRPHQGRLAFAPRPGHPAAAPVGGGREPRRPRGGRPVRPPRAGATPRGRPHRPAPALAAPRTRPGRDVPAMVSPPSWTTPSRRSR